MCIVTCIVNKNNLLLTSNRDIPKKRPHSLPPKIYKRNKTSIIMPKDSLKNGTWVGATLSKIVCLLNHSGIENKRKRSRGKLVVDILSGRILIDNLNQETKRYNPYQIIYLDSKEKKYYTYIWDGKNLTIKKINFGIHIWLSTTIYSDKESSNKKKYFLNNCSQISNRENILEFHLNKNNIIDSHKIKTTSTTQISLNQSTSIYYNDLIQKQNYFLNLSE